MTKIALTDIDVDLIKQHIIDPENSQLTPIQQVKLDRWISAAKLLDKNPVKTHAVKIHHAKFPEIALKTAYDDINAAAKIFCSLHQFDFDFWQTWALNSASQNIKKLQDIGTVAARKVIAMEHANIKKIIGDKPPFMEDPTRAEKHQFFIQIWLDGEHLEIDLNNLDQIPRLTMNRINEYLAQGRQIDETEAEILMNT